MAFLGTTYDSDNMPEASGFDLLPAGWYTASIEKCEIKDTKAGTGKYLNLQYKISGPTHANRVVFGMVTLRNPNEEAERIGQQSLNAIMSSLGIKKLQDTDQLIGGNLEIKLTIKKDQEYGDKNEVKGWKAIAGSTPPAPSAQPPKPTAQAATPPKPAAPWQQKPAAPAPTQDEIF